MHPRRKLQLLAAICVAAAACTGYFALRRPPVLTGTDLGQPSTPSTTQNPTQGIYTPQPPGADTHPTHSPSPADPSRTLTKPSQDIRQTLAEMNDVPIGFYGMVIDQIGRPVPGAQVTGNIRIYNGTRAGTEKVVVLSGPDGRFHIDGGKGESLGITIRKDGYVLAGPQTEFKYSTMFPERLEPDPNNPVVIKLWKIQGAEPSRHMDRRYRITPGTSLVLIDLDNGTTVKAGGDLAISITRPPGIVSERTLLDWAVTAAAPNGGVIETTPAAARASFEVPNSGYQTGYEYLMSTNSNSWRGTLDKTFFFTGRDGAIFAKVALALAINQNPDEPIWIEVQTDINTNHSRLFESSITAN